MVYRPGDIRRTVETRLQALGVSRDVRAQLLSHGRSGGVQAKHYERHDFLKEKAAALALWESYLIETVGQRIQNSPMLESDPGESAVSERVAA